MYFEPAKPLENLHAVSVEEQFENETNGNLRSNYSLAKIVYLIEIAIFTFNSFDMNPKE